MIEKIKNMGYLCFYMGLNRVKNVMKYLTKGFQEDGASERI